MYRLLVLGASIRTIMLQVVPTLPTITAIDF